MKQIGYTCSEFSKMYKVFIENDYIYTCGNVYEPAEDTFLAIKAIEKLGKEDIGPELCVDIGAGTGILGIYCLRMFEKYGISIDINPCAIECIRLNIRELGLDAYVDIVQCDNMTCLRSTRKPAIIVYNTPYLPVSDEGLIGLSWSGGLREAKRALALFLEKFGKGCLVLVYSSLSGNDKELRDMLCNGISLSEIVEHFFFEDIKAVIICRSTR
ncbi:methyltransferase [Pyrofollis japonicus]|uniref:methyltransferase n=1 Tax=Pyrofollis japonicus TaxID=3060460 RepID=UPI00295B31C5|nr:methyltransferase [Pyrofollis japonicus]BEP18123.1 methyltransferase [Pyrofollis japonicus]